MPGIDKTENLIVNNIEESFNVLPIKSLSYHENINLPESEREVPKFPSDKFKSELFKLINESNFNLDLSQPYVNCNDVKSLKFFTRIGKSINVEQIAAVEEENNCNEFGDAHAIFEIPFV